MEPKQRPFSSKPVSTLPIYIDQADIHSLYDNKPRSQLIPKSKPKLSQIVPELPPFGIKSNSTALLYSKFVVKGLKEDKLSVVRSAFKKKQEITEACTLYRNRANKSIKTTTDINKTIQNNNNFQEEDSHTEFNPSTVQANNLVRASSAKAFKKNQGKQMVDEFDIKLIKNNTQANLHKSQIKKRSTTAKLSRKNQYRFSQGPTNDENRQQFARNRPLTANHDRKSPIMSAQGATLPIRDLYEPQQINQVIASKLRDVPLKIQSQKGINYIERNIQNISTYSRKSSIYLTNANVQNLITNRKSSQLNRKSQTLKIKTKQNINERIPEQEIELRPQQIFKKPDAQKHEKQIKTIEHYLMESMPSKFQLVSQQIRKEQKRNHTDDNYQQLLSLDLDNGFEDNKEQINEKSAKACFEDYILNCQILQYNIASKLKNQQVHNANRAVLDIYQCQQILEVYKQLKSQTNADKIAECITKIREMTKNLKYFSHKPKQQIDKLFTIPFQIVIAQEGQVIIQSYALVNDIYIILNGSVLVQSFTNLQSDRYAGLSDAQPLHSKLSLFDGQIFGETSRPNQKSNKSKITTLQQSLLLKVKHDDYVSVFFEGSEVQQKLQALRLAFKAEVSSGVIKEDDLQILSMSLQKQCYPSKSLVFRQGEIFDKLIIVRKGKLLGINEYILDQNKMKQLDMKEVDKYVRENRHSDLKQLQNLSTSATKFTKTHSKPKKEDETIKLSDLRRQNLINYEVLRQNSNKVYYYYMKQQSQFIKGVTINWRPILNTFTSHVTNNELEQSMQAIFQLALTSSLKPATYSLMSNSDQTQVYFLSRNAFQYLPNDLKSAMYAKARDKSANQLRGEQESEVRKWNTYKQKLCNQIVRDRQQRSSKRF